MKASELVAMDNAALKKQLDDLYQEIFNLRFQRAAGQLSNYNRLSQVKRDVARIKTVLSARGRAEGKEAKAQ